MSVPQTWTVPYRVRFDEAGPDGCLRASGWLRYAQDLAWQHSEAAGFERGWYAERGLGWLVRMAALRIHDEVAYGSVLAGTTEVVGWRRVWARRQTSFRTADGRIVAEAHTDWVLLTADGRPARIPDEIVSLLAASASYRPGKVEVPETPPDAARTAFEPRRPDLDPLGHLNSAAYLDVIDDGMAAHDMGLRPRDYRVEYVRPVVPGSRTTMALWRLDADRPGAPTMAGRMTDAAGKECFRALLR